MRVYFEEFTQQTERRLELVDITERVEGFIRECEVELGICLINSLHSTAAIVVNEREEGLKEDVIKKIREGFPQNGSWLHDRIDNNAVAHLASTFLGHSKTFPIKDGRLHRGAWQNIFLIELDGPRTRHITCEVMGEK